jgi:hypothetical protein
LFSAKEGFCERAEDYGFHTGRGWRSHLYFYSVNLFILLHTVWLLGINRCKKNE